MRVLKWLIALTPVLALAAYLLFYGQPNPLAGGLLLPYTAQLADGRAIALTFDDGPDPIYTPQVLNALARYNVQATFFVLGRCVDEHPELVRQIIAAGHTVGSHSYSHPIMRWMLPWDIAAELQWSDEAIYRATGAHTRLLRHPGGMQGVFLPFTARGSGWQVVTWDIDPRDYTQPGADEIVRRVLGAARPGAIVLLHDGSPGGDENRQQTVDALPAIIEGLRALGYNLVRVE
jgi:peptidoglycan/xylan/chitin deacetylase (PgdA/CDA1 family)